MSSSVGAGPSKRRGQYSSRACNGCRRRRVKCDGQQPICGTCALNSRECEWSADSDARRPVTKQLVEGLRSKIKTLEAEIQDLEHKTALASPNPNPNPNSNPPPGSPARRQSTATIAQAQTPLELLDDASDTRRPQPPTSHFNVTAMYRYIFQIDTTIPVHQQSRDVQLSLVCDWSRYLPQIPDVSLSRLEHDTLLLRCFKYGFGLLPELFLHDMLYSLTTETEAVSRPRLQHYTPFLHCSIMAFACAFSDDPLIRAPTTRAAFAGHAKQWMDEEFREPVMCLVRALALLAEYHCGVGDRDSGYMYMGMSFRAARVLAPTNDHAPGVPEGMTISPESTTRDWYLWSAFVHDKIMAIEYNREYDMPIPHPGISLPSVNAELDQQPWPLEVQADMEANNTPARLTTLTSHESCKLMIIATRIIELRQHVLDNKVHEQAVLNLHLRLDTWFNKLPENLLVWARSASPLPHVIVLHICYWWLLIVLHEPLYRLSKEKERDKDQDQPMEGTEQRPPITDLSIKMCDRAAHKIVQLLTIFDGQHGLRFFPRSMIDAVCACSTALFLEYTSSSQAAHKKRSDASSGVQTCVKALRAMEMTWPVAKGLADGLQARLQETCTSKFSLPQLDGPTSGLTDDEDPDLDDATDISNAFYQYMYEWGFTPTAETSEPESPYSHLSEVGWEGL